MKIRGSLQITKSLLLPNPEGTTPRQGLFALSNSSGSLYWDNLIVPPLDVNLTYPTKGTLVYNSDKLYFTIEIDAPGTLPLDPVFWVEVGSGTGGGTTLPQNIVDALNAANAPSSGNAFATLTDINNFTIYGSATVFTILGKDPTVANKLWIATDTGLDSYSTPVAIGDGLVSDGSGWKNIGQIRGPIGDTGATGATGADGPIGPQGPAGGGVTVEGSDTVANILLKDSSVAGLMWIATDSGSDSYSAPVVSGDGLVSDGTGWGNVGQIRGPQGDPGPAGPGFAAGGTIGQILTKNSATDYDTVWADQVDSDKNYTHDQASAASAWTINHTLNKYPSVTIVDSAGNVIDGEVIYVSSTQLLANFNTAFSGKAYLN